MYMSHKNQTLQEMKKSLANLLSELSEIVLYSSKLFLNIFTVL